MILMKNALFALCLLISSFSFADAWDNLTKKQADAVIAELKENPYIFDYCDCCGSSEDKTFPTAHLMKVTSAEIITCTWNSDYYSILVTVDYICEVVQSRNEGTAPKVKASETNGDYNDFSMNYTWGFNTVSNMATPFFDIVYYDLYDEKRICGQVFMYPNPKDVKKVSKDKGYAKWFKKSMQ